MSRLSIAFLVDSVDFSKAVRDGETSLGGSESACLGLARALKARGHYVHIYATKLAPDAGGADAGGVLWHPAEVFHAANQFLEWDVVVALRECRWYMQPVHARLRLLWNQDLLMPGVGAQIMSIAWQLDRLVYVSEYHRAQWEDQETPLAPIGWVTKNGYDPTLVPQPGTKDPHRIIHISRPERALGPLLRLWPLIKQRVPEATLQICRYSSMYDPQGWGQICASWDAEVQRVNQAVGGITYLGELNKRQLYQAISDAAVMWYPGVSTFAETSCIAAIEAMACGTPFVGSLKGALPETAFPAFEAGHLVAGDASADEAYAEESLAAVTSLLEGCARQSFAYRRLQRTGRKHVEAYTFEQLAAEWEAQIETWFTERYQANRLGVMRQLLHEDDHVAAKVVAESFAFPAYADSLTAFETGTCVSSDAARAEAYAAREFCDRVIAGKEQTAEDYAAHAIQDPLDEVKLSGRLRQVVPKFQACTHVLDVACGNGAFAIGLALAHPTVRVLGLDYAAGNIDLATAAAARAGVGDRCEFLRLTVYDFDTLAMHQEFGAWAVRAAAQGQRFDGLFVGEFVEHVADCTMLVDALEQVLAEGSTVVYTCPSGPFGELVPRGQPIQRGHVHNFKSDDVQRVWGGKAHANVEFLSIGVTGRGAPIGHWMITYTTAANRPAGQRDLAARTRRTRPLPRLSVGLIVLNAENDLGRCLSSVWGIADEIVVGDTGSTDDTVAIAEKFGARVLSLTPIEQQREGFAGARNQVLDACTGDWFFWIDADEQLTNPHFLRHYLPGPIYNGFVIHQKHLYQDQAPTHDIPVRIFRTHLGIRFFGCVHEQPQHGDCNTDIFPTLEPHDIEVLHTGYLTNDVREAKRVKRNMPLIKRDQEVFPDRMLGKVILLREAVLQAEANAAAAGWLSLIARAGFEHGVSLFVNLFDDPSHKYHQLVRMYYEQGLRALGMGFEMEIAMAGKAGGLNGSHAKPDRIWVRDAAEFERLATFQAKRVAERMTPKAVKTDPFVLPKRSSEPETEAVMGT